MPYAEGKVTFTLTVETTTANAAADGLERAGVFRLNVTPAKVGTAHIVIDVAASTGLEHFRHRRRARVCQHRGCARQAATGRDRAHSYAKERSWETDFATAPAAVYFPGAARIITVPSTAIVREGKTLHVYVQRTPERFEFREVTTRRTIGDAIEIISGLREGERVVVHGADKMPRL